MTRLTERQLHLPVLLVAGSPERVVERRRGRRVRRRRRRRRRGFVTGLHSGVTHGHRVALSRHVRGNRGRRFVFPGAPTMSHRPQDRTRVRVDECHSPREHDVKTPRWGATRRIYRTNRHVNVAIGMSP